ncbi:MAG TPA: polysaccharide lyase family 7 protein [Verrucomicrobiae bacterium]|nr:polysaccharide lyase family 7 protein [Verrucomicrobiae bacterium]
MRRYRFSTFALVLLWSFWFSSATAWALDPNLPPSGNFDLSHWKLQLPTSNGVLTGTGGSVDEIKPAQLVGFTNAYFYTGSDGSMVFWCPDDGATTSGSTHPRSELREELIPGNDGTNWTVFGTHILTGQCKVLRVPSDTQKVCIGQMHEPNTKPDGSASVGNEEMIMFDFGNKKIYVNINLDGNVSSSFSQTLISGSGVATNSTINYTMSMVNGLLKIVVNNVSNSWNLLSGTNINGHIAQNWDLASGNTLYFKAGDYNQTVDTCNCSTDGAQVAFYSLTRFHAPSITNQPAGQTVTVGSNVTLSVGALGTPPLKYAWAFNGAPLNNNPTNTTLSLPNVQLTNAGNYSVIVTDITGVVTSSVAVLTVNPFPPTADFTATPTNGVAPLNVTFSDASISSPTNWVWNFGDTGTSTLQNPLHNYGTAGVFTVRLIASNSGGSSTNTKTAYINVITPLQSWSNTYGVSGDSTDPFGTGMSNTNKFLVGFNPTNPAAYLHIISIANTNSTDMNVIYLGANGDSSWSPGIASRTNVLEFTAGAPDGGYSSNFISANVTNILGGGTGNGVVTNMVDAGGATNTPSRYYRVRVLVP